MVCVTPGEGIGHGKKGFVIPTKSFVKIGITKIFCYSNKCLVLSTKRLVAAANFLVAATKILFVVPNFVAITKPFFFRGSCHDYTALSKSLASRFLWRVSHRFVES